MRHVRVVHDVGDIGVFLLLLGPDVGGRRPLDVIVHHPLPVFVPASPVVVVADFAGRKVGHPVDRRGVIAVRQVGRAVALLAAFHVGGGQVGIRIVLGRR